MGIWGSSSFFITGQGQINKIISVSEWLWGMVGSKTFTLNLGPHRARQDFFAWKTASKEKVLCTAGTMLPSWNYSFLSICSMMSHHWWPPPRQSTTGWFFCWRKHFDLSKFESLFTLLDTSKCQCKSQCQATGWQSENLKVSLTDGSRIELMELHLKSEIPNLRFRKSGIFLKIWNFFENFKFFLKFLNFSKNLKLFQKSEIELMELHLKSEIFWDSQNLKFFEKSKPVPKIKKIQKIWKFSDNLKLFR